jgi:hypothetical protein
MSKMIRGAVRFGPATGVRSDPAQADRIVVLEREIARLRQAHWDGRAIGGFDNDGDPSPRSVSSDFAALILEDWRTERAGHDELVTENEHLTTDNKHLEARLRLAEEVCEAAAEHDDLINDLARPDFRVTPVEFDTNRRRMASALARWREAKR